MALHPKQKGDLRILFWNVQDWNLKNGDPAEESRLKRIIGVLRREKPDIALFAEIADPAIKERLAAALPGHGVFQTNCKNQLELAAVFKQAADRSITVEQRNEFSNDALTDRTYPLVRVISRDFNLAVLGVHTKSGSTPESMAKRLLTFGQIGNLNSTLAAQGVPLLALGDMNTMGNGATVTSEREISILDGLMTQRGLKVLAKDKPHTWHGIGRDARYADCSLDQVLASTAILGRIRPAATGAAATARVRVGGWPERPAGAPHDNWVRRYSDHAYIVVDIAPAPKPAP